MTEKKPLPYVIIPDDPDYFEDHEIPALKNRQVRCIKIHTTMEDFLRFPEIPRDSFDLPDPSYPHEVHPAVPVGTLGKISQHLALRIVGGTGKCVAVEWFLDDGTRCSHIYNRPEFNDHCEFTA